MNMFAVCGLHVAFGLHPNLAETLNTQMVEQEPTGNIKRPMSDVGFIRTDTVMFPERESTGGVGYEPFLNRAVLTGLSLQ